MVTLTVCDLFSSLSSSGRTTVLTLGLVGGRSTLSRFLPPFPFFNPIDTGDTRELQSSLLQGGALRQPFPAVLSAHPLGHLALPSTWTGPPPLPPAEGDPWHTGTVPYSSLQSQRVSTVLDTE